MLTTSSVEARLSCRVASFVGGVSSRLCPIAPQLRRHQQQLWWHSRMTSPNRAARMRRRFGDTSERYYGIQYYVIISSETATERERERGKERDRVWARFHRWLEPDGRNPWAPSMASYFWSTSTTRSRGKSVPPAALVVALRPSSESVGREGFGRTSPPGSPGASFRRLDGLDRVVDRADRLTLRRRSSIHFSMVFGVPVIPRVIFAARCRSALTSRLKLGL